MTGAPPCVSTSWFPSDATTGIPSTETQPNGPCQTSANREGAPDSYTLSPVVTSAFTGWASVQSWIAPATLSWAWLPFPKSPRTTNRKGPVGFPTAGSDGSGSPRGERGAS
jgi:hypothetical protein